jgi:hypothetical protein
MDPYDHAYFGNPASPYFYLYLASLQDNDQHNQPVPYQAARQQCKSHNRGVATWVFVLCLILALIVGVVVGAFIAGATL